MICKTTIKRHGVPSDQNGLSPMQAEMLSSTALLNVVYAPTGAGKSFVFRKAVAKGERVLFIVPTKRLGENQRLSMIEDMCDPGIAQRECRPHWTRTLAEKKIQVWDGNFSERLRAEGHSSPLDYYAGRLGTLSYEEGGEIIFATPELIACLLLKPSRKGTRSDVGANFICSNFDRIVYDESHTIEERGFGLVSVLALASKSIAKVEGKRRASIFLLSATPLSFDNLLTKIGFDTDNREEVRKISETVIENGDRILHGDVCVEFHSDDTILDHLTTHPELIENASREKKAVLIYDSLRDLRDDELPLTKLATDDQKGEVLFESSQHAQIESETSGRTHDLNDKAIIASTSTIEVGVTIRNVRTMIVNPGMSAAALLQRIGRAARGDMTGKVIVVFKKRPSWLMRICKDLAAAGETVTIHQFSEIFAKASKNRQIDTVAEEGEGEGEAVTDEDFTSFGTMGTKTLHCSALFHHLIERRLSETGLGGYAKTMRECAPKQTALMGALLRTVETKGWPCGKEWVAALLNEAENLRSFSPTVTVCVDGDMRVGIPTNWLAKNTTILETCPLEYRERGDPIIRCSKSQWNDLKDKSERTREMTRPCLRPDGSVTSVGRNPVSNYLKDLENVRSNPSNRDALKAVKTIISMTGFLPYMDSEIEDVGTSSVIL